MVSDFKGFGEKTWNFKNWPLKKVTNRLNEATPAENQCEKEDGYESGALKLLLNGPLKNKWLYNIN